MKPEINIVIPVSKAKKSYPKTVLALQKEFKKINK